MKKLRIDIEIFFMAVFGGYAFWRNRISDGFGQESISKLHTFKEEFKQTEGVPFIDYEYARKYFN